MASITTGIESKTLAEIKELLLLILQKGTSDELKFIAGVLYRHLNAEI